MRIVRRRRTPLVMIGTALAAALVLAGCSNTGETGSEGVALHGVTDKTVKVGFSVVDIGTVAASLGFKQPNYGGFEKQSEAINAIVAYINKNGGMGGRQV